MSLYMETTAIAAERSASEITILLVNATASQISTDYGPDRKIRGLRFILSVQGSPVVFSLPARTEPVFRYLQKRRSPATRARKEKQDRKQAERVAWRQLLRWVQAQLALIETGMVEAAEVFLPYIERDGTTLYQHMLSSGALRALPAPAPKTDQASR